MNAPVALITGGARRVGAEIARQLHAAGWQIAIHYRQSVTDAEALTASLNALNGATVASFAADLLDTAALPDLVGRVLSRFGRLDALVNNASSFYPTAIGELKPAQWDDLLGSNPKAPLFLAQAAAPYLKTSAGCIVNITDIHAERPLKGFPVYSAAKGGLLTLTRALAIELAPEVRVNAVAPGAIEWPDDHAGELTFPAAERDAIIRHTLLQRIGCPADIGRTVKFLICDAPYITGQVINVDGGRTAHL